MVTGEAALALAFETWGKEKSIWLGPLSFEDV